MILILDIDDESNLNVIGVGEAKSVDCLWDEFDEWSACSKTCGSGEKSRSRSKINEEENGGVPCVGNAIETEACNTLICPVDTVQPKSVDCLWDEFDEWTSCSKTCGSGEKSRSRSKVNEEENGGVPCVGNAIETEACYTLICPVDTVESKSVDCLWDIFDEWSSCSKTCGIGERSRSRSIVNKEENGGTPCVGNTVETEACNTLRCNVDAVVTKTREYDVEIDKDIDPVTLTKNNKDEGKELEVLKNSGIVLEEVSMQTSEKYNGK